ncbi:MFS transporter, partial [Acinetobacter oleivorans]
MLDLGHERDWFNSTSFVVLGLTAAIGFVVVLIWELTDKHPVVDVKVFRHRGFASSVLALSLGFGAFFGSIVLIPQWLQLNLSYT